MTATSSKDSVPPASEDPKLPLKAAVAKCKENQRINMSLITFPEERMARSIAGLLLLSEKCEASLRISISMPAMESPVIFELKGGRDLGETQEITAP